MKSTGGSRPGSTYLAHVIIHTAARHELKHNTEVGLPRAGSNELNNILMPDFPHDGHLLQAPMNTWAMADDMLQRTDCTDPCEL